MGSIDRNVVQCLIIIIGHCYKGALNPRKNLQRLIAHFHKYNNYRVHWYALWRIKYYNTPVHILHICFWVIHYCDYHENSFKNTTFHKTHKRSTARLSKNLKRVIKEGYQKNEERGGSKSKKHPSATTYLSTAVWCSTLHHYLHRLEVSQPHTCAVCLTLIRGQAHHCVRGEEPTVHPFHWLMRLPQAA